MAKKKGRRAISVNNPTFTVIFEEDADIFFKTNSVRKTIEFFENGEVITMEATNANNGEQVSTGRLRKFSISFKTGVWKVATDDCVYKISSK